jgi:hypothetical protein
VIAKIRAALVCVLLLAAIVVAIYAAGFVVAATVTIASVPAEMKAARADLAIQAKALRVESLKEIDRQANALRGELHGEAGLLDAQMSALQKNTFGELAAIRSTADKRTGESLARVDTALQAMTGIRADLQPVLKHAGSIAAQVDDAAPLYLDCEFNPDCAFNRFQGTSKAVEQTMQAVAKAAPKLAAAAVKNGDNVAGITTDIHTITKAATKPKSFFGKVWAGITVFSRFAGLL